MQPIDISISIVYTPRDKVGRCKMQFCDYYTVCFLA